MRATYLDGIPILFDHSSRHRARLDGDDRIIRGLSVAFDRPADDSPDDFERALLADFGDRIHFAAYEGEFPLRAHALIASLAKVEEIAATTARWKESRRRAS